MPTPFSLRFSRPDAPPLAARLYGARAGAPRAVLYLHAEGADEAAAAEAVAAGAPQAALVCLSGERWEQDLSPWPAPRAFRGGADFAGGAEAYLAFLCAQVLPAVRAALAGAGGTLSVPQGLAGYSLAGLFSIYASYYCSEFSVLASMSGSFWYDGFAAWAAEQPPRRVPDGVYFSLGIREPRARDPRLAAVGPATLAVRARFAALGAQTVFAENEGGHFDGIPARCAAGALWAAQRLTGAPQPTDPAGG
jgi:predicted alpha/beta superfamily hydrolase